ncbi:hypothetical protein ACTXT7_017458 [Hymenolepis weldensis]
MVLPTVSPNCKVVKATNDDIKLHTSMRGSEKVANLTRFAESSMSEVVLAGLVFEPSVSKQQQQVPTSCNAASLGKMKSSKCPCQCNHIRAKTKLVCCAKRSVLVDDKCKEPEEIDFTYSPTYSNGRASDMIAQNTGKTKQTAAILHHQDLAICTQSKVPWCHSDLNLGGPMQSISHLILMDS